MDLHTATDVLEYENPVAVSKLPALQVEEEISETHSIEVDNEPLQVESKVNEMAYDEDCDRAAVREYEFNSGNEAEACMNDEEFPNLSQLSFKSDDKEDGLGLENSDV